MSRWFIAENMLIYLIIGFLLWHHIWWGLALLLAVNNPQKNEEPPDD